MAKKLYNFTLIFSTGDPPVDPWLALNLQLCIASGSVTVLLAELADLELVLFLSVCVCVCVCVCLWSIS